MITFVSLDNHFESGSEYRYEYVCACLLRLILNFFQLIITLSLGLSVHKNIFHRYKCLIEATEDTCGCAALWVNEFDAQGGTNVVGALDEATCNPGVDAVYLLSDGLPDSAPNEVLDVAERMSKERGFRVHTISFNADSEDAREFLQLLAERCGGRYHQYTSASALPSA